jgi:hypothetical protein
LQSPGETRDITIVSEGDDWAILSWKPPADGGSPAFYGIQRRQERILALERASKRWTRPVKDWWAALNHLSIVFEGRVPV